MKRRIFAIMSMVFAIVLVMSSCKKENVTTKENATTQNSNDPSGDGMIENAVTDIDGNTYDAVKLGNQVWMAENLRTTKYADGTSISLGSSRSYDIPYRYYPDNNSSNVSIYGYLYNLPAVIGNSTNSSANSGGAQGICPNGWHVPSDAEWKQLTQYVKSQEEYVCAECSGEDNVWMTDCIAKAMASTTCWNNYEETCAVGNDLSGNNATGFNAVPAGYYDGDCHFLGYGAYFWTATQFVNNDYYCRILTCGDAGVSSYGKAKCQGYSVRCVRN